MDSTLSPAALAHPLRVQFHSHDSFGLGHLRRTLTLAGALARQVPSAEILITTGSPCATHFALPDGVEIVKLPSVSKDAKGSYVPRSLGGDLASLVRLRRALLSEVQRSFNPDVLVVDHQVLGLGDELHDVLAATRAAGTRTILGLRDIIDAPDVVAREWGRPAARQALREWYDRVCVYGDPRIFDARAEYPVPEELRANLEFVGYVGRAVVPERAERLAGAPKQVLVTVGGGEDGYERLSTYLDALELGGCDWESTVVCGPLLDQEQFKTLKRRARRLSGCEITSFHADLPHLLSKSDAVVAMSGYNTSVEIMQSRVPAVLLPRCFPRREQLIRAERMQAAGLAQCVETLEAGAVRDAVKQALGGDVVSGAVPSMTGAEMMAGVVVEMAMGRRAGRALAQ